MDQEAKKARNKYMKEWRVKNKEKVRAAQERYWEKKSKVMKNIERWKWKGLEIIHKN